MRDLLDSAPMKVPAPALHWIAALYERNYALALSRIDQWNVNVVQTQNAYRPKSWFYGVTYELAGNSENSAEEFRGALDEIGLKIVDKPDDLRFLMARANILAHLGEREAAIDLANRVVDLLPMSIDAVAAPNLRLQAVKSSNCGRRL